MTGTTVLLAAACAAPWLSALAWCIAQAERTPRGTRPCESCQAHSATTRVRVDGVVFDVCDGCRPSASTPRPSETSTAPTAPTSTASTSTDTGGAR